ncbi:MFS transporter [Arthrobacter bambusae]|uniref:MFS transporter n=1 Tax=Arthrobacter bambusae TaxID=1338426 RepID=UPI002780AA10|nr:MFS transporter [Arthrobacter bambusae]MDQ0029090.1 MFS family permease [Arthrobacter bambusae]MDQ0098508.1 MFS family permease [Arthrobacter bambusae]
MASTNAMTAISKPTGGTQLEKSRARRAAVSALVGGALEYYDFFLYSLAAATVFPTIMFPSGTSAATGILLSLGTLGVGYVARPAGAVVFAHFGDKFGRKRILVLTIVLMGLSTFTMGFLPTYAQVGLLAPVLLVVMRLVQGLSAGAETTGASTLTLESAPHGRRAFYTSFTQSGNSVGFVLANVAFLPIAALPHDLLFSWGWRIPFFASAIVVVVALIMRTKLEEPVIFVKEVVEDHQEIKIPLFTALRRYPWGIIKVLLLTTSASIGTMLFTFGLAFATRPEFGINISFTTMIWASIAGYGINAVFQPFWGLLSDRIGRRPLIIFGAITSAVMTFAYFAAIVAHNIPMIFVTIIGAFSIFYAAVNAVSQTFSGELFDVRVRYSASAVGFNAGIVVVGFVPAIATAFVTRDNWMAAPVIVAITCIAAAVAAVFSKETNKVPLEDLG